LRERTESGLKTSSGGSRAVLETLAAQGFQEIFADVQKLS